MDKDITDRYFDFLYSRVAGEPSYVRLSSYLHNRWEFRWSVDYDENRQADGYDQRESFLFTSTVAFTRKQVDQLLNYLPVSVFEVLVAICDRMDFNLDDLVSGSRMDRWYRELLTNLSLDAFDDDHFDLDAAGRDRRVVDDIIQVWLDRTYGSDGDGSLFPLVNYNPVDRREVEIWYQMMDYLQENYPV